MNLPNKLSIFRMILVPVCVLVKCFPYAQYNIALGYVDMGTVRIPVLDLILLGLFVIGSLTGCRGVCGSLLFLFIRRLESEDQIA